MSRISPWTLKARVLLYLSWVHHGGFIFRSRAPYIIIAIIIITIIISTIIITIIISTIIITMIMTVITIIVIITITAKCHLDTLLFSRVYGLVSTSRA